MTAVDLGNIDEEAALTITQAALLVGSSDVEGDSLTAINLALTGGSGTIVDNLDGTWTFNPTGNFNGPVSFSFDVDDGTATSTATTPNTAILTVDAVNDRPTVAAVDLGSIDEEASLTITQAALLAGSSDVDDDLLTAINLALTVGSGTIVDNLDGTFTFTPTLNFNGPVSFSFDVDDGTATSTATTPNTASLTIDPVNDAPIVTAVDLGNLDEDNPLLITQAALLAGSSDVDGDSLTAINLALTGGSGTIVDHLDGTFTFNPTGNFNGPVSFSFDVDDGTTTTPNTASLTVDPVNDPPTVAAVDLGSIDEETSLTITQAALLTGSSDVESDSLTAINLALTVGSGMIVDNLDGTFTFTPTLNFNGPVSLSFDVNDGTVSTPNTASLTVNNLDDPPVPMDDINALLTTSEDTLFRIDSSFLLANDVDPDLGPTTPEVLSIVSPSPLSALGATVTYDPTTRRITYDPTTSAALQALAPGERTGPGERLPDDSFTYSITDLDGEPTPLPTATVFLTITGVNDAPIVRDDVVPAPTTSNPIVITPLENDVDVDGTLDLDSLIITVDPKFGSLAKRINSAGVLELAYSPFTDFTGSDSFRYTISDNLGLFGRQATVTIAASNAPQTGSDIGGGVNGDTINIDVLANDVPVEGQLDPLTLAISTDPAHGQAIPQSDGTITYIPNANFYGSDSFQYTIKDTLGNVERALHGRGAGRGKRTRESNSLR